MDLKCKIDKAVVGAAAAASLFVLASSGPAVALTVGVPLGSGSSVPFNNNISGSAVGQSMDYFQIYSSDEFPAVITFDTITFFTAFPPAPVPNGNYNITFGITSAALGTGGFPTQSNVATFFNGILNETSVLTSLSIVGTAYTYDPSLGNLLMEVVVTNQAILGNHGGFAADGNVTSSIWHGGECLGCVEQGLVTQFDSPSPVPLPAALPLFASGLAGLGWLGRRRRRQTA